MQYDGIFTESGIINTYNILPLHATVYTHIKCFNVVHPIFMY